MGRARAYNGSVHQRKRVDTLVGDRMRSYPRFLPLVLTLLASEPGVRAQSPKLRDDPKSLDIPAIEPMSRPMPASRAIPDCR
jgi:hypothetical protein